MKPALLLPLLLAACAIPIAVPVPHTSAKPQQIYGQWQITELAQQNIHAPNAVLVLDSATLQFSARTDCNRLFGQYNLNADTQALSFNRIASTRMACKKADIEKLLTQTLPQVRKYRVEGRRLTMLDGQGRVLLQGNRTQ